MARSALLRTAVDESTQTAARSALILAPHPDDETLGCGVTILRKIAVGTEVTIAVVSDGRHSHASDDLSPSALAALRRGEMAEAAGRLGVPLGSVHWGGFFDTTLDENYEHVVDFVRHLVTAFRPDEVYATCADEPHPDHAAVGRAARQVVAEANYPIRLFEYPIWLWSRWPLRSGDRLGSSVDAVRQVLTRKAVKIKSDGYVSAKLFALSAHASQLGRPDAVRPNVDWPGLPTSHIADAADKAELFLTPRIKGIHR
jgi:LmbE family N-acetylglucosaminyl deacetylase